MDWEWLGQLPQFTWRKTMTNKKIIEILNKKKELLESLLEIRNEVSSGSHAMSLIDDIFKKEGYMTWKAPHGTMRLENVPRIYG
jgi:hypothetical protein